MNDIFESLKTMPFDLNDHNPSLRKWGIGFPHTEETKKYISEMKKGLKQTPEHIQNRVNKMIGFKQSDYQKETASKKLSAEWIITNPNGDSIKIKNLRKFCIDNNLDQGNMVKVSKGIIKQNKGWKCIKIEA
jgi:hypothetical protein